jgi:hypothetical protein
MSDEVFVVNEAEESNLPVYRDDIVEIAEKAEKRIAAVNKIKQIALRVTNPHDWVNQGGKPYLQSTGAEKIARLFGISWRIDEPMLETFDEGHFAYTYKGYFSFKDVTIEVPGTRSSKDPFFSGSKENPKPVSEIDRGDVKKSAYTNCTANGVTRLLGIRNLTWEDLAAAGIDKDKTSSIDYGKKEMSEKGADAIKEIGKLLIEMAGNDKIKAADLLEEATTFKGKDGKEVKGRRSLKGLSEKQAPVTLHKVKKMYKEWEKDNKGGAENAGSGDSE